MYPSEREIKDAKNRNEKLMRSCLISPQSIFMCLTVQPSLIRCSRQRRLRPTCVPASLLSYPWAPSHLGRLVYDSALVTAREHERRPVLIMTSFISCVATPVKTKASIRSGGFLHNFALSQVSLLQDQACRPGTGPEGAQTDPITPAGPTVTLCEGLICALTC